MSAYYTAKQNLEDFSVVLSNIRGLVNAYLEHVYDKAEEGDKIVTWPNLYTFVRAIEVFFCNQDLSLTVGTCLVVERQDESTLHMLPVKHYWLTWRCTYIIDVVPVDGKFGLSLPSPVFEENLPKRFKATSGIYESSWSKAVRELADIAVEDLVSIFDLAVQKTPS